MTLPSANTLSINLRLEVLLGEFCSFLGTYHICGEQESKVLHGLHQSPG